MTIRIVNIGQADKGNGDPLRTAFDKINKNFQDIDNIVEDLTFNVNAISGANSVNEFDFGKIQLNNVTSPLQLLFLTSTIDLGYITDPNLINYDAGNIE